VYVIIAFADVTAGTFVQKASAAGGDAPGPAVATSSIIYLGLAIVMGLCMRKFKLGEGKAQLIFLPLVVGAIALGPYLPFDLGALTGSARPQVLWDHVLLAYCFFAALSPVWLLMQPRGALGGYFLYVIVVVGVVGVIVGGRPSRMRSSSTSTARPRRCCRCCSSRSLAARARASTPSWPAARRRSSSTGKPTPSPSPTAACCSSRSSPA
jgi:carbon starvation protein CstA